MSERRRNADARPPVEADTVEADAGERIELAVQLDAPAAAVWRAISDAQELRRWFPLDAAVEPGVGGSITLSWGPDVQGTAPIEVWQQGERLRWVEEWPGDPEPVRVAVDLRIESVGGVTVLRLVHSGFRADDDWSDYIDTLESGWRYFLLNLRHYLERHPGSERHMVWDRRRIPVPRAEAWARLVSSDGLAPVEGSGEGSAEGSVEIGARAHLWTGHAATVILERYPIHLALGIPDLDDALLFVELEPGDGSFSLGTWLSLYGDAGAARAAELQETLRERLDRLFGATPGS